MIARSMLRCWGGLRGRLFALVLLTVVPVLTLVVLEARDEQRHAEDAARTAALHLARDAATDLQRRIDGARDLLASLAAAPDLVTLTPAACDARLTALRDEANTPMTRYTALGLVALDGTTVCSAPAAFGEVNLADRAYFRRALQSRRFAVGDFAVGRLSGKPALQVGMPVLDAAGEPRAVVLAGLDFSWLDTMIPAAGLPDGAVLLALDQQGALLARYPAPPGGPTEPGASRSAGPPVAGQPVAGQPVAGQPVAGQPVAGQPFTAPLDGDRPTTLESSELDGISRLYATAPIPGGGLVVVGIPRVAAFAEANHLLTRSLLDLAAASLLAVIAAWIGSQAFVLQPVRRLVEATRRLASGDLTARSGLTAGWGELGQLGTAFDQLAVLLAQREAEQAHAQAALLASQERSRLQAAALDNAANGVFIADRHGAIVWINPAFTHLTGYTPEDAIGRPAGLLSPGESGHATEADIWRSIGAGLVWHGERVSRRKDGSLFRDETTITPVRDEHGEITHFVSIKQDVTERKRAEAALAAANRELAAAAERARDLAFAATAADRAKSEFLAAMSHEIRTPMNGVIGMASLLLDSGLTDEQREYAETIRASGDALLVILNDILDVSKIEAGKLTIEPVPFTLPDTVRDVTELLGPAASGRGLTLTSRLDPAVPRRVIGDAGRIRQVLLNLVGNAIKFTPQGSVTIDVTGSARHAAEVTVTLHVRDTGIGIPPEKLGRLFQRFSQADASTTRKYGGTGLGLAISKGLVELMGGEIGVASEPDQGSTFTVTLPLALDTTEPPERADGVAPTDTAPTGVPPTGAAVVRSPRVLLVEDNVVNQKVARRMLEKLGCRVDIAANGAAAIEAVSQAAYDLILMDCQMPEVDGFEATRSIRAAESPGRHLPIVAMTASAMQGDRERCLTAGMDEYLSKPVAQAALTATLRRWLADDQAPLQARS